MAEKIISPGVFTKEIDASFLPTAIGDIGAVIIGPTPKGPALTPTVVTSYQEFQAKFGDSFKSGSNYYQYLTSHTAKNYLNHSSPLTVVRIMGSGYSSANATISSSIDPAVVGGGTQATGSFTVVAGEFGGGTGTQESMSIGGVNFIYTGSGASYTNSSTNIYVVSSSDVATTAAEFREVINNSSSLHSLSISASSNTGVVGLTSSLAGRVHGLDGLQLVGGSQISGTLNLVSSSVGSDPYTSINQLQGGSEYSDTYKTPFKLHTLSDGNILNNSASAGTNNLLTDGSDNNIRWEIGSLNQKKGTFTVLVRRGDDTEKKKQILETWNNCSLDPNASNYIGKVIGDQTITLGGTTADPFLEWSGDYSNKSKYIRVEVLENTFDYLDENGNVRVPAASASLPSYHSGSNSGSAWGSFSGGSDGTVSHPINFNDNIGQQTQGLDLNDSTQVDQYTKALNLLSNTDEYDFNLLLIPGIIRNQTGHTAIVTKAIDICESRGDAFTIVDSVGYSTNAIGTVTDEAKSMDSNYAATYWPWVQVNDPQTGKNVWTPPSVVMAGIYAYNDKIGAPWFAPAGLNRGVITTAIQAKRKLTQGNRDDLYESNVNPIATFPGEGVTVWGQKTLQKKSSALDRVNVRRLLIKVKKFLSASSRFLVFEQNTAKTRGDFLAIANPYLEDIRLKSGLNEFKVIMDTSNNTPDIVDRNILYGQIFIQPTKTAEFIVLDFTVQPTGASFPE
jgi:hypothetical protein